MHTYGREGHASFVEPWDLKDGEVEWIQVGKEIWRGGSRKGRNGGSRGEAVSELALYLKECSLYTFVFGKHSGSAASHYN